MTTVGDILDYLETLAPRSMKMDWDNVGLLCGGKSRPVTKVLVALDPFEGVCREAKEWGAELIVTHHPLIFNPLKAVTDETTLGRSIQLLCASGISAVNAHTNLDCAPGGVNDCLAAALGLRDVRVIDPQGTDEAGREWGLLRMGTVECQPLSEFLPRVKNALHCQGLRYADGGKPVHRVAVLGCPGCGADPHRCRAFPHGKSGGFPAGGENRDGFSGCYHKNLRNPRRLHEILLKWVDFLLLFC